MFKKLAEGHWGLFLLSMVSAVANLFLPIVLVRLLTPEQMGVYKIFFLYAMALPFYVLAGAPLHSVYYWVGKRQDNLRFIQQCFVLSSLLSLLILPLGLFLKYIVHFAIPLEGHLFFVLLLSAVANCPANFFAETHIAFGKRIHGQLFHLFFVFLKILLFLAFAYFSKKVEMILYAYLGLMYLQIIANLLLAKKHHYISFQFDIPALKKIIAYSLPIGLASLLSFFLDKVDQLLLASVLDKTAFAYYSMGCLIVPPLIMLDVSVQQVLLPKLSEMFASDKSEKALIEFKKAISNIANLVIPAVFGLILFSREIIILLYSEQYIDSIPYLQIFALTYITYIIPHDAVARATGHTGWILKFYAIITPCSIVAVYLMAKNHGAMGALAMAILFKFIGKAAGLTYSAKIMKWRLIDTMPFYKLSQYTLGSLVLTLLTLALKPLFSSDQLWFITCAPIFAVIYLSFLFGHKFFRKTT